MKRVLRKLRRLSRSFAAEQLDRRVIRLSPGCKAKGHVLLAYIIEAFITDPDDPIYRSHTHYWETHQMVTTFLELGYAVDLISYRNTAFRPARHYDFFVSARTNFDRIAALLNDSCKKVVHLDTAHWITNNHNAYGRLIDFSRRRKTAIKNSVRLIEHNLAIENADMGTILGNDFTIDSYAYAQKPIHRIPISSPICFDWGARNIDAIRKNYLWFGSGGFVHKGLDLVLELFAGLPDYQLYVCGPLEKEKAFVQEYQRELYQTENIHPVGWVDINDAKFKEILDKCLGIVYPSCAEGGGGSVIACMQAGVIPVVSRESSVDIADYGVTLKDSSLTQMRTEVVRLSGLSSGELADMAQATWQFASGTHTKASFAQKYREFVQRELL